MKYVEDMLQKSASVINGLQNDGDWEKAVLYFVDHTFAGPNQFNMHYLLHIKNIGEASSEERKLKVVEWLATQYAKSEPSALGNGTQYTKIIFKMVTDSSLFGKYYKTFIPIRFDNDYNNQLIQKLLENQHLDRAEYYCREQIRYNYREEYNTSYLIFLKLIYISKKDDKNLALVLEELFPATYNFGDYLFIIKWLGEDEGKKWRTKMLSRASNASNNHNKHATNFVFTLMDYEKKYKKMIEYINGQTPFTIILKYFEPMALTGKKDFFRAIAKKSDDYSWGNSDKDKITDSECLPALFEIVQEFYSADELKSLISSVEKENRYHYPNLFLKYIKERLTL